MVDHMTSFMASGVQCRPLEIGGPRSMACSIPACLSASQQVPPHTALPTHCTPTPPHPLWCRTLLDDLTTFVKAKHPYDECEVIALPIEGGSPSYLKWVMASTKEK